MNSFENYCKEKLPNKKCFYRSVRDGTTDHNCAKLNGT